MYTGLAYNANMSLKSRFWLWVGVVIGVYVMVRTGNNIIRLYKAGGRVKEAQVEIDRLQAEKRVMEKRLAESQTEDYVERIAREKLGLGKPGEVVVIIDEDQKENSKKQNEIEKIKNWQLWRKLYLGF